MLIFQQIAYAPNTHNYSMFSMRIEIEMSKVSKTENLVVILTN